MAKAKDKDKYLKDTDKEKNDYWLRQGHFLSFDIGRAVAVLANVCSLGQQGGQSYKLDG